jgi:iron complex outermembrane recepter protein
MIHESTRSKRAKLGTVKLLLPRSIAISIASSLLLSAGLPVIPAFAERGTLEEIVVTARKREESAQDIPVTVSAIGAAAIDKYDINDASELVARVPGLQMSQSGSGSNGSVRIRGIGNSSISAAFDTAVAINIDGVQTNMARILRVPMLDMRQIEVLKGPQSLYFGKSASAGVITLQSGDPTDEFDAQVSASHEFEEDGYRVEGYVSGPLSDTLKGRIAASWMDIDQLVKSSIPGWDIGGPSGVGTIAPGFPSFVAPVPGAVSLSRGQQNYDARMTLQWDPTANLSAEFKLFAQKFEDDGRSTLQDVLCANGATPAATVFPAPGFATFPDYDCDTRDGKTQNVGQNPGAFRKVAGAHNGRPYSENDMHVGSLRFDWDITEALKLISVTGWFKNETSAGEIDGGSSVGGQSEWGAENEDEAFSEELRLESDYGGRFDFQLGGYWQKRETLYKSNAMISATVNFLGPDPVTGNDWDYTKAHPTDIKAYSFFGNAILRPIETVQLNVGARWSKEKHDSSLRVSYMHAVLAAGGLLPSGSNVCCVKFDDDNISPEASVFWNATENVNLFAAYKTGFKSGGLDNSVLPFAGLNVQSFANAIIFDSETAKGFEVGAKTDWLDNSLRFNVTAFLYKVEDLQLQEFDFQVFQFDTKNAGEAETKGIEIETVWQTPVEGLLLSAGWAYADSKFTDDFIVAGEPFNVPAGSTPDNMKGEQLQGNSKLSGNFSLDYTTLIPGTDLNVGGGILASYRSKYRVGIHSSTPEQDAFWKYDVVLSLAPVSDRWKVSLIGQNLGDKRSWESSSACRPSGSPNATGTCDYLVEFSRGRQVSLEATLSFN